MWRPGTCSTRAFGALETQPRALVTSPRDVGGEAAFQLLGALEDEGGSLLEDRRRTLLQKTASEVRCRLQSRRSQHHDITQTLAATDRLLAPEGPPAPPPQAPPTAAAIGWVRGVWARVRQDWQRCQALGQAALSSSAGLQVG